MSRTPSNARGPWSGKTRGHASGNTGDAPPRRGAGRGKSSRSRLFGDPPDRHFDQEGIAFLFEEQKRLKDALRRQARLVRQDVNLVVSVQAEQLRQINSTIAVGLAGQKGLNEFLRPKLTTGQESLARSLGLQGLTSLVFCNTEKKVPELHTPLQRRRVNNVKSVENPKTSPPSDVTRLEGPLLREFSRAKGRGYRGPPSRWLVGPVAKKLIARLRQKGIIDPLWTGKLSLFERHSPLRWVVSGCSAIQETSLRHGLFGERIRNEGTNVVSLVRQARSVKRLTKQQWPRSFDGGYAWPSYPTFFESWECAMRGKSPTPCLGYDWKETLPAKRPLRQVKPGSDVRTISKFVLGIRADIEVPRKFLAYFSYRWGFLILRRDLKLPRGLVRNLISHWKTDITRMFLVCPIRYNDALRRIPDSVHWRLSGFVAGNPPAEPHGERRLDRRLRRALARQDSVQILSVTDNTSSSGSSEGLRLY